MPLSDLRITALTMASCIVAVGTAYSVLYHTYLDTSDPLLTHLPHPLHATHYFASKSNFLNVFFIKKAWAWTSLGFISLYLTRPAAESSIYPPPRAKSHRYSRATERALKWVAETAVWCAFAGWFFGPALIERLIANTGGECVVVLPSGYVLKLPVELCYEKGAISPATHPSVFAATLLVPEANQWAGRPRLRRGHDISGHVFLLTMGSVFLMDQIRMSIRTPGSWSTAHKLAVGFSTSLVLTSWFALYTTSVYFHSPGEKLSGLLLGVLGFLACQLPWFESEPLWTPALKL